MLFLCARAAPYYVKFWLSAVSGQLQAECRAHVWRRSGTFLVTFWAIHLAMCLPGCVEYIRKEEDRLRACVFCKVAGSIPVCRYLVYLVYVQRFVLFLHISKGSFYSNITVSSPCFLFHFFFPGAVTAVLSFSASRLAEAKNGQTCPRPRRRSLGHTVVTGAQDAFGIGLCGRSSLRNKRLSRRCSSLRWLKDFVFYFRYWLHLRLIYFFNGL